MIAMHKGFYFFFFFVCSLWHSSQSEIVLRVPENVNPPHTIATVSTYAGIGPYTVTDFDFGTRMSFDVNTGVLKTNVMLDREEKAQYKLDIIAQSLVSFKILVVDKNDNRPKFSKSNIVMSMAEDSPVSSQISLGSVSDADGNEFSLKKVEITKGNVDRKFELEKVKSGEMFLRLVLKSLLDYETTQRYNLEITAYDGGVPPLTATLLVTIDVTNLNDEVPTFDTTRYLAVVDENRPVSSTILNVSASDKDLGPAGTISYFINHSRSDLEHYFSVNEQSGAVVLQRPLDYERQKNHTVIVSVRDHGTPVQTASVHVQINVRDVNDHAPQLSLEFLSGAVVLSTASVSEAVNVDDFVARLSVQDSDSSQVTVQLINGGEWFSLISPTRNNYMLMLRRRLDREVQDHLNISLLAKDNGKPQLSTRLDVRVTIKDANDRAPVFEQSFYSARIAVDSPVNTTVVHINASDEDAGENGRVSYRIVDGGDHPWFKVDPASGVISTSASLSCRLVTLLVQARDNGSPRQLTDNATVQVSITGSNMHTPMFTQSYYAIAVKENTNTGVCFYQFHASDADCGAGVAYNLVPGSSATALFRLEQYKGRLCVRSPIDRDRRPSVYQLLIQVTDKDSRHSIAAVDITVEDLNDNRPAFVSRDVRVSVPQTPSSGLAVAAAAAHDRDSGRFAQLSYSLTGLGIGSPWRVDAASGIVSYRPNGQPLPTQTVLTLQVQDAGGLLANASMSIRIFATDSLRFEKPLYRWTVDEGLNKELGVLRLVGRASSGALTVAKYSGDPDERLSISSDGRVRSLGRAKATNSPLVLVVRAVQALSEAFTQVVVTVRPTPTPTPVFERITVQLDVLETTPAPSVLYRFFAGIEDGRIRYSLVSGRSPLFGLNTTTGQLRLLQQLDFETASSHQLKVRAAPLAGSPSAQMTLNLRVLDANDHKPVCTPNSLQKTVPDSAPVGYLLAKLNCVDKDKGQPNGRISYILLASSEYNLARVDANGRLELAGSLNSLVKDTFTLRVRAQDGGSPPLFSDVNVTVKVLDTNNMAPRFSQAAYTFWVTENAPASTFVGHTGATDGDRGANARFTFKLAGTTAFKVNPENGALSTAKALDREAQERHEFTLLAQDHGVPSLTGSASVTVTVLDVNDQHPQFAGPMPYTASLDEGLPAGADVLVVSASDKDLGANGTVSYALEPTSAPFAIHAVCGLIVTTARLDYELTPVWQLTVVARDGGSPPLESRRPLRVQVNDIDERSRLLNTSQLAFFVLENSVTGTLVGLVQPRASNASSHRSMVYRIISQGPNEAFSLDYASGKLRTIRPLDREKAANYSLVVQAVDLKAIAPPRSATASVKVKVLDLNDNGPQFVDSGGRQMGNPLYISVREEGLPGTQLFKFRAPDSDAGLNGTVAFHFRGDPSVLDYFNLGPVSGILRVVKPIDRETVEQLAFEVVATDQCTSLRDRRSSALTVIVSVADINDHKPIFVSPRGATVLLDDVVNTTVMHVVARDPDQAENGRIVYALAPPLSPYFALGASSGLLTLKADLRLTEKRAFSLNITATDSTQNPRHRRTAWAIFTIAVVAGAGGHGRPVFTQGGVYKVSRSGTVMSGLAAKQPLLAVLARASSPPRYSLVPGLSDDLFSVHATSGLVAVRENANFTKKDYAVPVVATDPSSGLMALARVELKAQPTNQYSPTFGRMAYRVNILEQQAYTSFMVLTAHDLDPADRGSLRYAIQSGNTDHKFILDPVSGRLSCVPLSRDIARSYRLIITARDGGQPTALTGTTTVQVDVLDANNHAPIFTASRYSALVSENQPAGTPVLNVSATDTDEGENGRVWYQFDTSAPTSTGVVSQRPDFAFFSIDSATGEIQTAFPLDRERQDSYTLTVEAFDGSREKPFKTVVTVDVTVSDRNDNAPEFTSLPFTAAITRTERNEFLLVALKATDRDLRANLSYRLVRPSTEFRVDSVTGNVITQRQVQVTAGMSPRVVTLEVEVSDGLFVSRGLLEITVGGPTFHQLIFSPTNFRFTASEGASAGDRVGAVALANGSLPVTFDIIGGNAGGAFRIDPSSGALSVNVSASLDFEVRREIPVWVRARSADKVGFAKVVVAITDSDDNEPKFAQSRYLVQVFEKSPVGQFVVWPVAVDLDSGPFGKVTYSFAATTTTDAFSLDAVGKITVRHGADYYQKANYKLIVQASSENNPSLIRVCTVDVRVLNRNNHPPTVSAPPSLRIPENRSLGSEIARVSATDVDNYPPLTFHLFDQPNLPFAIGLFSGQLTLVKPLDFENPSRRQFSLRVTVSDSVHLVNITLGVSVTNVNDNPPMFNGPIETGVPLGSAADFVVITLNATDADGGSAPTFARCGSLPSASPAYLVNPSSGKVITRTAISSATASASVLCVEAKDSGGLASRRALLLEVTAANRHAPVFQGGSSQRHSVREDTAVGETVFTFRCSDEDPAVPDRKIRYEMVPTNPSNVRRHFSVVRQTGQLVLIAGLDREKLASLTLSVTCTDTGRPPRTATAQLVVQVDDVNDNSPRFLDANYTASVTPEEMATGLPRQLVRLAAEDIDQGANGRLRFRLLSGPRFTAFGVNETSGWVLLTATISTGSYELVVEAADCMGGRLCTNVRRAFASVTVKVAKKLPDGPTFPANVLTVSMRENIAINSPVFKPSAHGAKPMRFEIEPGLDAAAFGILNGVVVSRATVDYETKMSYKFRLKARDPQNRQASVLVHVQVIDVDEFPPKFDKEYSFFAVPRGIPEFGQTVAKVKAVDEDRGIAGLTAYLLVNASTDYFQVRPSLGEIYVAVDITPRTASTTLLHRRRRSADGQSALNATAIKTERKNFTVVVQAWSGVLSSYATVSIEMDVPLDSSLPTSPRPLALSGTLLVLVVVVAIILSGIIIFLAIFYSRRRCHTFEGEKASVGRRVNGSLPPSPPVYESTFDPVGRPPLPPRCYETSSLRRGGTGPRLGLGPASSGRGSDSVADEELRMITRGGLPPERLHSPVPSSLSSASKFLPGVQIPDSGVQMAYSDLDEPPPASNHVEYLAQLGVGSCNGGAAGLLAEGCGGGLMLGGLGMTPEEISLRELERREEPMLKSPPTVSRMVSALSPQQAAFDDANFRLDHLLNWTPSYQPLAQVFSEIARLKDEPAAAYMSGGGGGGGGGSIPRAPNGPPLFTDLPPQVLQPTLQPSLAPLTEHEVQI